MEVTVSYVEWLRSWQKDSLQEVYPCDAYLAGARAMLQALIDKGYISPLISRHVEEATKNVLTVDLSELELYLS